MTTRIFNIRDVGRILDLIRDRFFNQHNIHFDEENKELTIKFEQVYRNKLQIIKQFFFLKRLSIPVFENILRISYVEDFAINDPADLNKYDFDEIRYDDLNKTLLIAGGLPFEIYLKASHVDIEVIETNKFVKNIRKFDFF